MKSKRILSVVIPVYNEEKTVTSILDTVLARPEVAEIIVVDDGSTDNSRKVIAKYAGGKISKGRIKLLAQDVNKGKGAAIRRGFDEASAPIVMIQDADNEYSPDDYEAVVQPIISGRADVVYGSRFQVGSRRVVRYRHRLGNKILTTFSNWLTDIWLTDMETCYKAFRREVIHNINLETNRFGIEVELTAKIARARELEIYEVPISYFGRSYGEGKKITWKDGIAAFWHMIRYNCLLSDKNFYKRPWKEVLKRGQ